MAVLVAQDNDELRPLILEALKRNGLTGVFCATHEEAFDILKSRRIVGIILELGLPMANGLRLLRRLREDREFSQVPVIAIGTPTSEILTIQCKILGLNDLVPMPVDADFLAQKLSVLSRIANIQNRIPWLAYGQAVVCEKKPEWDKLSFHGSFDLTSALVFRDKFELLISSGDPAKIMLLDFSDVQTFSSAEDQVLNFVLEIAGARRKLIVAGRNFGVLLPLLSDPQKHLFINEADALDFLASSRRSS